MMMMMMEVRGANGGRHLADQPGSVGRLMAVIVGCCRRWGRSLLEQNDEHAVVAVYLAVDLITLSRHNDQGQFFVLTWTGALLTESHHYPLPSHTIDS
jgi:hypothetical protein